MERLERRDNDLRSRMETLFDGVDARLGRIEHDVAAGRLDREGLRTELDEVRRDLGETRAAAAGAATQAVHAATGAAVGTASLMVTLRSAKLWQKGGALAASFCALAWVADKGPAVVRFLNHWGHSIAVFWQGIGG